MKKAYKKATAKVTLFDNSDVVTTSFLGTENDGKEEDCEKHQGWYIGNKCNKNRSEYCEEKQAWKD